jgi:hypothetical protein
MKKKLSHYKPEQAHVVPGIKATRFLDIGHEGGRLSALRTGRLYAQD